LRIGYDELRVDEVCFHEYLFHSIIGFEKTSSLWN
jgi:hypothetical protein